MGPPHFNPCMASASLAPVGFLPVVRSRRTSIFSPSRAPGARRFSARPLARRPVAPRPPVALRRFVALRPPPSLLAVSSPRGLACTFASPVHARRAALVPARRVRHSQPDALHPRPPGQPKASPPRPTHHAPACYPARPPVGSAVAAEFAPDVGGRGVSSGWWP
ncbi:unnamed protein product [Closterium sp. NIES-53]